MKFPSFHRPEPPEMSPELTAKALMREFLFDSQMERLDDLSRVLDLPPLSDEVASTERAASNNRCDRIVHLGPLLHAYAHSMASSVALVMEEDTPEEAREDFQTDSVHSLLETVSLASLYGAVSQLLELGILQEAPHE